MHMLLFSFTPCVEEIEVLRQQISSVTCRLGLWEYSIETDIVVEMTISPTVVADHRLGWGADISSLSLHIPYRAHIPCDLCLLNLQREYIPKVFSLWICWDSTFAPQRIELSDERGPLHNPCCSSRWIVLPSDIETLSMGLIFVRFTVYSSEGSSTKSEPSCYGVTFNLHLSEDDVSLLTCTWPMRTCMVHSPSMLRPFHNFWD